MDKLTINKELTKPNIAQDDKVKLGDFSFQFIEFNEFDIPVFDIDIGSKNLRVYDTHGFGNPKEILNKIKNNIWFDEDNNALEITFEDSCFSFIKLNLPISGWDGEFDGDLPQVDILIRYTDPYTNNIATLSNIKEIENFTLWYSKKVNQPISKSGES